MRNSFTAIVLLWCIYVSGQPYQPMPDTNAVWKEWKAVLIHTSTVIYTDNYTGGDTTINSLLYTKIYSSGVNNSSPWSGLYEGAMRNDTSLRLVYFVPRDSINEVLLYDFNLALGQVFPMTWFNRFNYQADTITLVDSIWVGTSWRRHCRSASGDYDVVEGMGSLGGLFEPHLTQGSVFTNLLCFYQNDRPAWPDTAAGCASPVVVGEEFSGNQIVIYPVPSEGIFEVNIGTRVYDVLQVYNSTWELISTSTLNTEQFTVNLEKQPAGVYLFLFTDELTGQTYSRRVMIAR